MSAASWGLGVSWLNAKFQAKDWIIELKMKLVPLRNHDAREPKQQ
jgi:hypothetical protein